MILKEFIYQFVYANQFFCCSPARFNVPCVRVILRYVHQCGYLVPVDGDQIASITQTCLYSKQLFLKAVKMIISAESFDIFRMFAQNIDCRYTLETPHEYPEAVLTCTNNLCFRAKIRI